MRICWHFIDVRRSTRALLDYACLGCICLVIPEWARNGEDSDARMRIVFPNKRVFGDSILILE